MAQGFFIDDLVPGCFFDNYRKFFPASLVKWEISLARRCHGTWLRMLLPARLLSDFTKNPGLGKKNIKFKRKI